MPEGGHLLSEGANLCFGGAFLLEIVEQQGQKGPLKCPQECRLYGIAGYMEFFWFVAFSVVAAEDRGTVSVGFLPFYSTENCGLTKLVSETREKNK